MGRVTVRSDSVGPKLRSDADRTGPNHISAHKYPNMTGKPLYDPKFCVDSEYVVRFVRATRNHELRVETGIWGQAHQVGNPRRPDRTDPISELSAKFWSRRPKLGPSTAPYIEKEVQWLNALFVCETANGEMHFFLIVNCCFFLRSSNS